MNTCIQPWKLSAVESSRSMHAAAKQYGIPSSTLHDHIKSTERYACAPIVLTAEEKEIITGAAKPDHLLEFFCPTCSDCIVTNFKHPSAPITTPVHHHSSSTVVYSL